MRYDLTKSRRSRDRRNKASWEVYDSDGWVGAVEAESEDQALQAARREFSGQLSGTVRVAVGGMSPEEYNQGNKSRRKNARVYKAGSAKDGEFLVHDPGQDEFTVPGRELWKIFEPHEVKDFLLMSVNQEMDIGDGWTIRRMKNRKTGPFDEKTAFFEGQEAYEKKQPKSANPYKMGDAGMRRSWDEGWDWMQEEEEEPGIHNRSFSVVHSETDEERGQYETKEEADRRARELGSEYEVVEKSVEKKYQLVRWSGDKGPVVDDWDAAKATAIEYMKKQKEEAESRNRPYGGTVVWVYRVDESGKIIGEGQALRSIHLLKSVTKAKVRQRPDGKFIVQDAFDNHKEFGPYETREEAQKVADEKTKEEIARFESRGKGWKADRVTYDTDGDGKFWAVNNDTGDRIGPYDSMDEAKGAAKEKGDVDEFVHECSKAAGPDLKTWLGRAAALVGGAIGIALIPPGVRSLVVTLAVKQLMKQWERGVSEERAAKEVAEQLRQNDQVAAQLAAVKPKNKVGLSYEPGTRVEVPGMGTGVVDDVSLLGRTYKVRLDNGEVEEFAANELEAVSKAWDKGYNDGWLGHKKQASIDRLDANPQYREVQKSYQAGRISQEQLRAECKSIDEAVAKNIESLATENEYSRGYSRGAEVRSQEQRRQVLSGESVSKSRIIRFYEDGKPVTDNIDYDETIWAEGQLTAREEDIIEHLSVGQEAKVSGGWTVRRIA